MEEFMEEGIEGDVRSVLETDQCAPLQVLMVETKTRLLPSTIGIYIYYIISFDFIITLPITSLTPHSVQHSDTSNIQMMVVNKFRKII